MAQVAAAPCLQCAWKNGTADDSHTAVAYRAEEPIENNCRDSFSEEPGPRSVRHGCACDEGSIACDRRSQCLRSRCLTDRIPASSDVQIG